MAISTLALVLSGSVFAKDPDCTGSSQGPAITAQTWLKEAHLLDPGQVDAAKTVVTRLSSQQIAKNLFRQVHLVLFAKLSGEAVEAIAVTDVSNRECSIGKVDIYLISQ